MTYIFGGVVPPQLKYPGTFLVIVNKNQSVKYTWGLIILQSAKILFSVNLFDIRQFILHDEML